MNGGSFYDQWQETVCEGRMSIEDFRFKKEGKAKSNSAILVFGYDREVTVAGAFCMAS
jgi:hypothetical protein